VILEGWLVLHDLAMIANERALLFLFGCGDGQLVDQLDRYLRGNRKGLEPSGA